MERVKKGEKYWRIWSMDSHFEIRDSIDDYGATSTQMYEMGNYFHTKEEAKAMSRKLRAVLKGADVIEMPSEEECEMIAELEYPTGADDYLCVKGIELAQAAFNSGINWLKSKIVK